MVEVKRISLAYMLEYEEREEEKEYGGGKERRVCVKLHFKQRG